MNITDMARFGRMIQRLIHNSKSIKHLFVPSLFINVKRGQMTKPIIVLLNYIE